MFNDFSVIRITGEAQAPLLLANLEMPPWHNLRLVRQKGISSTIMSGLVLANTRISITIIAYLNNMVHPDTPN